MKRLLIFCLASQLCLVHLHAQSDSCVTRLAGFVKNIRAFNNLYPQEKVYLHFDNTGYFAGDTIWFKAYVVSAIDLAPAFQSKVLYVELLTPEGQVIETRKLKVEDGQCHGEFALDEDWRSGFYEVRAYTRVMLNYDAKTLFSRVFPVYKEPEYDGDYSQRDMKEPFQNIGNENLRKSPVEEFDKVDVTFFPEGGNLVNGISSKVAFKATDQNGQGINVTGAIYNDKNEEITTFSSTHNGMGAFSICPDSALFKVKIYYNDKSYNFKLPEIVPIGYVLTANNRSNDYLLLQLQKSNGCRGDTLGISVICRGKVCKFFISDMASQQEALLKIPKVDLPTGINQVTVFNQNGTIIAQRMVYVNNEDCIRILGNYKRKDYKPFEKISMDFSIRNSQDSPVETTFSLAVRDAATEIPGHYADNIKSDLLLSSDLNGFIEDADYYLEVDDPSHRNALDLLLMVQGWSRYSWNQLACKEPFECTFKSEKGIVIDGKVYSSTTLDRKEKANIKVKMNLYSENAISQKGTCMTDNKGRFNFLVNDFEGKCTLTLQTTDIIKGKEKNIWTRIPLGRAISPSPRNYTFFDTEVAEFRPVNFGDIALANLSETNSTTQVQVLKDIRIKARKSTKISPDIIYDVEKEIDDLIDKGEFYPPTAWKYLVNKNPKFWFDGQYEDEHNYGGSWSYGSDVVLIIGFDERGRWQFSNGSNHPIEYYCQFRPIEEVQKIVVSGDKDLWRKYPVPYFAPLNCTTLLVYPFKNAAARSQKGIRITYLDGYSQTKRFYNPDYSKGVLPGDVDYRRTLYWNPDIKTDSTGKASISFYNNSSCKKMTISAETVTKQGIPGSLTE